MPILNSRQCFTPLIDRDTPDDYWVRAHVIIVGVVRESRLSCALAGLNTDSRRSSGMVRRRASTCGKLAPAATAS